MSDTPHAADTVVTTPGSSSTEGHESATGAALPSAGAGDPADAADLAHIAADFDGVEDALRRLDEGTYWTDEITGEAIADGTLAADPIARRAR